MQEGVEIPGGQAGPDTSSERARLIRQVKHLQQLAVAGVSRDNAGHVDAAAELYEKVIKGMDELVSSLPAELQSDFIAQRDAYQSRLTILQDFQSKSEASLAEDGSRKAFMVPFEHTVAELSVGLNGLAEQVLMWEPEPDNAMRRPFWVLRLIRSTITAGGYLTPRLHVPKVVWEQDGARFSGLTTKVQGFEAVLRLLIDRIAPLELPKDVAAVKRALFVFNSVRIELDQLQNNLARPFPFIREVAPPQPPSPPRAGSGKPPPAPATSITGMQQRLSSMVMSIGKTVTKSATTAYERIGAAVPAKISDVQLTSYAVLVADVCDKCQLLDNWSVRLERTRKEVQDRLRQQAAATPSDHSAIEASVVFLTSTEELVGEMHGLARFIHEVVVELLIRDVEGLVERYLRKMRKAFARMEWEDEQQAAATGNDRPASPLMMT